MFWYDGKPIEGNQIQIAIDNPGLCYGATSFTTMRVYESSLNSTLTNWQAHCDRLKSSIKAFNWQQPNWHRLQQGAETLAVSFPVLRMTIFPDGREWITGRALPPNLSQKQATGIKAWIARDPIYHRELPSYKTGNYLSAYLARNRAIAERAAEAILLRGDRWLETSTGSLWGWREDCWYTPRLESGILPGIARLSWIRYLQERNIKVVENTWHPEFVATLEGLGYSNCVVEYVPIVETMDGQKRKQYTIEQLRSPSHSS